MTILTPSSNSAINLNQVKSIWLQVMISGPILATFLVKMKQNWPQGGTRLDQFYQVSLKKWARLGHNSFLLGKNQLELFCKTPTLCLFHINNQSIIHTEFTLIRFSIQRWVLMKNAALLITFLQVGWRQGFKGIEWGHWFGTRHRLEQTKEDQSKKRSNVTSWGPHSFGELSNRIDLHVATVLNTGRKVVTTNRHDRYYDQSKRFEPCERKRYDRDVSLINNWRGHENGKVVKKTGDGYNK